MSGILDKKSRILDAILTIEGRRQMAEGTFNVSYVTFTDNGVSYIPDSENGHEDPTDKIYLEACNLPQDQITFEANDNGKLISRVSQDIKVDYGPFSFLSSSVDLKSNGVLENGRLSVFGYAAGRTIKVQKDFFTVSSDLGKGFTYGDSSGVTASILVDPFKNLNPENSYGVYVNSSSVALIGTQAGQRIPPEVFATKISNAIAALSQSGGPKVSSYSVGPMVFLDNDKITNNLIFELTGNLSSPLLLNNCSVGNTLLKEEVDSAYFSSAIEGILTSSFDNFLDLQTISSINRLFEDDQFDLSTKEIDFDLRVNIPERVKAYNSSIPTLNSIDSLFNDDKVSHLDNYLYLPPIVKASDAEIPDKSNLDSLKGYFLGNYPSWGNNESKLTYKKLANQLSEYTNSKHSIAFTKTSLSNNIIGQFFEIVNGEVSKLDVVDYGYVMDDSQEPTSVTKRVFFVGKTYIDDRGTVCFVNLFTLIFERDDSPEVSR